MNMSNQINTYLNVNIITLMLMIPLLNINTITLLVMISLIYLTLKLCRRQMYPFKPKQLIKWLLKNPNKMKYNQKKKKKGR